MFQINIYTRTDFLMFQMAILNLRLSLKSCKCFRTTHWIKKSAQVPGSKAQSLALTGSVATAQESTRKTRLVFHGSVVSKVIVPDEPVPFRVASIIDISALPKRSCKVKTTCIQFRQTNLLSTRFDARTQL